MAILTINSGSSSLKLGIYSDTADLLLTASADAIGTSTGKLSISSADGTSLVQKEGSYAHQQDAFDAALAEMHRHLDEGITAVGHRVVHGGPHLVVHQRLTPEVLQQLRGAEHFAPLHIPAALELIQHAQSRFPDVDQFVCFDTAFHQTMPPEAYTYAIPARFRDAGVRRFGFHGLSYESVVHALGEDMPRRVVVAHLGSGASGCALLDGKSVDTSMGVSPTGGFPMGTRSGDLDPGVVLLLQRKLSPELPAHTPDAIEQVLNHESGLQALAGESDMRKLLHRSDGGDDAAALALAIYTREIAKTIAGYFVVLGGVDLLVFTGGIGEHSGPVRERICAKLQGLGVQLDGDANARRDADVISAGASAMKVRVLPADENGQIARHVTSMLASRRTFLQM